MEGKNESKHTPEVRCAYCGPDGTIWNGDSSKICPHCKGSGFQLPTITVKPKSDTTFDCFHKEARHLIDYGTDPY